MKIGRHNLYEKIEAAAAKYTKNFTIFIFLSCAMALTMPIFRAFFFYLNQLYSFEAWYLPFKVLFVFVQDLPFDGFCIRQ